MCLKKFNFILLLPLNPLKRVALGEKLATLKLCATCSHRMFTLPEYATNPKSVTRYEFFWKNRLILPIILGDETTDLNIAVKASMLWFALTRRKNFMLKSASMFLNLQNRLEKEAERAVLPALTTATAKIVSGGNPAGNVSPVKI